MRLKAIVFPVTLAALTAALVAGYGFCVWKAWLPFLPLAAGYALMSLFTLAAQYYDKQAAVDNERRIPELLLHGLELMGGWPGSLLGQLVFWHKIKKVSYQVAFWIIVVLNSMAGLFLWRGDALLEQLHLPKTGISPMSFTEITQIDLPKILSTVGSSGDDDKTSDPDKDDTPPEPTLDELWSDDPATEPFLGKQPGVSRSRIVPNRQCRHMQGVIRAVSPIHGLLITLPPDIGGDGVVPPSTLVPDFQQRFKVGEQVVVAVKGIEMHGSRKQLNLFLSEP